jgi:hypothetical protein
VLSITASRSDAALRASGTSRVRVIVGDLAQTE